MRVLVVVLGIQVIVAAAVAVLLITDGSSGDEPSPPPVAAAPAALRADRFDEDRAWRWLERQVRLGPRPAGSAKSRRLAALAKRALPGGRYQSVPGGLRNVTGFVRGRDPSRYIVVGAHYDTKDIPGFVGANDGASGTAVLLELARVLEPRTIGPTVRFILFDGEESPGDAPDEDFEKLGLRGSKVAARVYDDADAMVLLDFVGDKDLRIPRENNSDAGIWRKLRASARAVGAGSHFPNAVGGGVLDDHIPFLDQGVRSINLIDFDFPCWHEACDDLSAVRRRASTPPARRSGTSSLDSETTHDAPEKLYLAAPRGYCAGVDRAVQTVERALELYGAPVYVRKEIVHNKHVVEQLKERGAIFVDQETEVPEGETVVFSAHGVSPAVHANAEARELKTIDATCPLVTKVHVEAKKFAAEGYTIVLIGHEGHEEVEGTMGEAPPTWCSSRPRRTPIGFRWTTRTASPTSPRPRCPWTRRTRSSSGCASGSRTSWAPHRRHLLRHHQPPEAVRQMAKHCDLVLVIGSANSSNSNRLVEVARDHGADSHLIDNETQVCEEWLEGKRVVGITSGASAPEELVQRLVEFFRERGTAQVEEFEVVQEDVRFMLPKEIRKALAARA